MLVDQVSGGNSKKENKPPTKRFGKPVASKGDDKGGNQGKDLGAMSFDDVRLAAERQGAIADQYLEFNRVKAARGSEECRRLRNNKL